VRGGLVDHAHELTVRRLDRLGLAVGHRSLETLRQRLHRRAVAEVLHPLTAGDDDALLLLLDVRHLDSARALQAAGS
jgi:hypothetical protein